MTCGSWPVVGDDGDDGDGGLICVMDLNLRRKAVSPN
jgi:hypothetical protein